MYLESQVAEVLPCRQMPTIPQKELRNNVADVLRRAQDGEEFTITVAGRPVAELGPTRSREWIDTAQLADLWKLPADPTLAGDIEAFDPGLQDPWAE